MKNWVSFFVLLMVFVQAGYTQQPVRKVGVGINVLDVTDIESKKELVQVIADFTLRWQTDKTHLKKQFFYGDLVDKFTIKNWYPHFKILSVQGQMLPITQSVTITKDGVAEYAAKYKMTIKTPLNLYKFPFDSQIITIQMVPNKYMPEKVEYYPLEGMSGVSDQAHHDEWEFSSSDVKVSNDNGGKFTFKIYYVRQAGYYIYKVFLPLIVIIMISYLVLWLPKQPAINRLGFIITAVLTIVAFQWVVFTDVPRVSYITYFEAMLLFSYFYIGSEAIIVVVGEYLSNKKKLRMFRYATMIYPIILLLVFIIISLYWFI